MMLNRKSIRLKGFDYSISWVYSITICTFEKKCTLGRIMGNKMYKNLFGIIVKEELINSSNIRKEIELDEYSIMPNHLHFIVFIHNPILILQNIVGTKCFRSDQQDLITQMKPRSLSSFISGFKSSVTGRIKQLLNNSNQELNYIDSSEGPGRFARSSMRHQLKLNKFNFWQRNYYDHLIRNEEDYIHCINYIRDNPKNWRDDDYNPDV